MCGSAGVGAAQEVGRIAGVVVEASSGQPLVGVNVSVRDMGLGGTSDSEGRYAVHHVPAGLVVLEVSAIGYAARTRTVRVVADRTTEASFELEVAPVSLGQLTVEGRTTARELRESPFAVTVLEARDLAGRALTLDDAIGRAAGVRIRRSGGLGSASFFNIRGFEGQRVQVFINGNAADVVGDALTLDDIPIQLVERVEVYKGVVPARLGGDGLGSAINVVTVEPEDGYVDVGLTTGSFGQQQLSATIVRPIGPVSAEVTINVDRARNDYVMESPYEPGLVVRRDHDGFERSVIGLGIGTSQLGFDEVELEVALIDTGSEIQGVQANVQHAESWSGFRSLLLQASSEGARDGRLDIRSAIAIVGARAGLVDTSTVRYDWGRNAFPSPVGRGELGYIPSDSENRTLFFRQRNALTYRAGDPRDGIFEHTVNLTGVFDVTRFRPSDPTANEYAGRNVSDFPGDLASAVVGLSHEWRPRGEGVVAVTGLRGYAMRSRGTPSTFLNPVVEAPPEAETDLLAAGISEAIRVRITPQVLVKGSAELARRLPTSEELFGDGLFVFAAPTLRPEDSFNVSGGLQWDGPVGDVLHVEAGVTGFWSSVRDLIRLGGGVAGGAFTNVGRARIAGIEADVRADVSDWISAGASLTWQDARDALRFEPGTRSPSPTYGLRLPNIPWLFGSAILEASRVGRPGRDSRTRVFVEADYSAEFFYAFEVSRRQSRRIPEVFTVGLGAEHSWPRLGLSVSAEARNLANARVLNVLNNPLPGRSFHLKLRYTAVPSLR